MTGRHPPRGAWFFRDADRYDTQHGFSVRHAADGWFVLRRQPAQRDRVRGPFPSLPQAMEIADRLIAAIEPEGAA